MLNWLEGNLVPHLKCPQRPLTTGSWRSFRPEYNAERCTLCQLCIVFCPDGVIKLEQGALSLDFNYCKGCGICAQECPKQAIKMVEEE